MDKVIKCRGREVMGGVEFRVQGLRFTVLKSSCISLSTMSDPTGGWLFFYSLIELLDERMMDVRCST